MTNPEYTLESLETLEVPPDTELIERKDNWLLLDLDNHTALDCLLDNLKMIDKLYKYEKVEVWLSKSGNYHARITLEQDVDNVTAIALQSILGSDPVREFLSLMRVENGVSGRSPTLLLKPNESDIVVLSDY